MTTLNDDVQLGSAAVRDIAELTELAVAPAELAPGRIYAIRVGGQLHQVDLTGDEYRAQPKRKTGTTTVRDVPSFATYWAKHNQDGESEVYATRETLKLTAVLDAHGSDVEDTGWRQHRLVLQLQHTTAFTAWRDNSGRDMTQEEFANFLEDNRADIVHPPAADMLEVAQSIQMTTKVDFAAGHRLIDGQRVLNYTEATDSKAGQRGELAIPAEITLGLFVFKGASHADVFTARFRHRIQNGQLRLSYRLDRPDDVVDAAFEGVVAEVSEQCGATVMRGTPA